MKVAILSDTRLPTREDYPGHGLGRSIARIAEGLVKRGHNVTLFGASGSCVTGCDVVVDTDENVRAERLWSQCRQYDVYLDSGHFFKLSELATMWPIVNKVCDFEGHPSRNAVYNSRLWAEKHGDPHGIVVYEGVDVDKYPYNPNPRPQGDLIWVGANYNVGWKRADIACWIATQMSRPLTMIGVQGLGVSPNVKQVIHQSPAETYEALSQAYAVIGWLPTMTHIEGAATGTPSLGSYDHAHSIADGITGFTRHTPEELVLAAQHLPDIKPKDCREWVASERNIDKQVIEFEALLQRAADGEIW